MSYQSRFGRLRRNLFVVAVSGLLLTNQVFAQAVAPAKFSAAEREILNNVKIETIKEATAALVADEMQGRGTMQPGGDKAANWIADRFKQLGLKPLGDKNSYLQKIEFRETVATPETAFLIDDERLQHGTDFGYLPMNNGDKNVSGEMVFVAYGIQANSIKRDDLAGIDVAGKIVVMLEGPPANIPKDVWNKQKASTVFMQNLIRKGAAALVYIGHGREENSPAKLLDYFSRRQITTADEKGYPAFLPPFVYMGRDASEKLFAKSGVSLKEALAQAESNDFKPIKLKSSAKIIAKYKSSKGAANNVVGYIEGSDPQLKTEAVLFSAHYDAYGVENGKIYHGAADNALGVAEMLAVAEAFAKMKPKRSMIFIAVTGEEYGLYGSKHWAKNPTWDVKKISANLNLDGVGTEVYAPVKTIVGYGAEHSTLGALLADVSAAFDVKIVPDPIPDDRVFYRSDHYSFVERGIPALKLMGAPEGDIQVAMKRRKDWEEKDYHQPGDTIQANWSWEGAETIAEVMGILGWRISEMNSMPSWLPNGRFGKLERGNSKDLPEEQ